jgi:4-coumarate--CoA ligase
MCKIICQEQIQVLPTVPPILNALVNTPQAEKMTSLEHIGCGAAPLDKELQSRAERVLGAPVLQGYGMSETTVGVLGSQYDTSHGTVGRLLPGVEARLVDDDEKDVKIGERGELLLKGPNITKGYFENSTATKNTFTTDGWLKTGDIAVVNPETEEFR